MKNTLLFVFCACIGINSIAQVSLVKDIHTASSLPIPSSYPMHFAIYNGKLYFGANDVSTDMHLWVCDTTNNVTKVTGTWPVGSGGLVWIEPFPYEDFAVANNKLYIPAMASNISDVLLHSFDGSTFTVVDDTIGSPEYITEMDGKIYFGGATATYGGELWKYDPITGTTTRLSDISPGNQTSDPQYLTPYNHKLYFAAHGASTGIELYVYDPVSGNTSLVQDINTGSGSSQPWNLTVYNGKLYFSAITAMYGNELYSYDGITVTRLTDFGPGAGDGLYTYTGSGGFFGRGIFGYKGAIYFAGAKGASYFVLSKYDIATGVASWVYDCIKPHDFVVYKNRLTFSATHATNTGTLWLYDTGAAPKAAFDLYGGTKLDSPPYHNIVFNNCLYFRASDSAHGTELFRFYDTTTSVVDTNHNNTSVQNISFTGEVYAYPNPAGSEFNIHISLKNTEQIAISLDDLTGKEVYNSGMISCTRGNNTFTIPMKSFPVGEYVYKVFNSSGRLYYVAKVLRK